MNRIGLGLAAAVALLTAAPVAGQVQWDAPLMLAPGSPGGMGIFLIEPNGPDPSPGPGGDDDDGFGVIGTWRRSAAPVGFGVRIGLAEDPFDDLAVLAGLDISGTLLRPTDDLPVGFIWFLGAGLSVGEELLASFPAGISAGIDLNADGVLFRPYVAPRVDLNIWSGPGDEVDMSVNVDLGLDLAFVPDWVIRFAASLGDNDAIAIGLQFPGLGFE